jgi:putative hemolysin
MEHKLMRKSREELPRITEKFFDVEKIFASKNPGLARVMPSFVFNILKRIIHQDELNKFLYNNRDKWGLDFARAILDEFHVSVDVINPQYMPGEGRYLVVSNHPLGGIDGLALIAEIGKHRGDIVFPVNDLLMNIPNLYELFIPINKHGSNAENIRLFNDAFASDLMILYFPAGLVSRKQDGVIKDLEWKKTCLTKAKAYKRDIIPVHIGGRNSNFFYNLANLRKKLGIKANIEMLFLVNEMFNLKVKTLPMTFGPPIPYTLFDRRKSDKQWAQDLRKYVYSLGEQPEALFDPNSNSQ